MPGMKNPPRGDGWDDGRMSSESERLASGTKAGKWLTKRGKRRVKAVDSAYGTLGLDYGKGHLDNLYMQAYRHGLRDAYAFTTQQAQEWLNHSEGYRDLESEVQRREEQGSSAD